MEQHMEDDFDIKDQLAGLLEEDRQARDVEKGRTWWWLAVASALLIAGLILLMIRNWWMMIHDAEPGLESLYLRQGRLMMAFSVFSLLVSFVGILFLWKKRPLGWALLAGLALQVVGIIYVVLTQYLRGNGLYFSQWRFLVTVWGSWGLICILLFLKPMRNAFSVRAVHVYLAIGVAAFIWFAPRLLTSVHHLGNL